MRRWQVALLVCLWPLLSVAARAQQAERNRLLELSWEAPRECDNAAQVEARVQKLLGAARVSGTPLHAEAKIERRQDGQFALRLSVHVEDRVGERKISGKSCGDLVGAAAVTLALLLRDGEQGMRELTPEPEATSDPANAESPAATPTAETPAAAAAAPAIPATAEPSNDAARTPPPNDSAKPPRPRRAYGLLQAPAARVGLGPLPQPSFGFSVATGAAVGRWRILAEGTAWLPQRVSAVHEAERNGADVQRLAAGVRACHGFRWARFQLAPCVEVSAEHLSARGTGPHVAAETAKATWCAAGAGAELRVDVVRWLSLVGAVDVLVQTARPTITIADAGRVAQLRPVAVIFTLGLEWIL